MIDTIEIELEERDGEYPAHVSRAPEGHRAVAEDPLNAIRGAIAVSRPHIDEEIGYERDPQ